MNLSEAMVTFPPIHVIYWDPKDYPCKAVVRAWYGILPGPSAVVVRSVDEARGFIRQWTDAQVCMQRSPSDDACIVESWL